MNASRVPFVAAALAKACSISTSTRRVLVRSLSLCFCGKAGNQIEATSTNVIIRIVRDMPSPCFRNSYHWAMVFASTIESPL